ncbi:MAG: DUF4013 domain-containing protein [Anaerolineae bacterium]|nr:DUF4013 domain-containing protein [Anaerolineae bacterium]
MDFGKSFTYMFEDPEWLKKLGIGTLIGLLMLLLIPTIILWVVPFVALLGYTVVALRNVMNSVERPLPEWDNWGEFFSLGFKVFAATFIWALPIILLTLPLALGSAFIDQQGGAEGVGIAMLVCGSCLAVLWGLFITVLTPAIYVRIAATDRFASAFELGPMLAFTRDNLGNVILALLLLIVVGIIASFVAMLGVVAFFVGLLITIPLASLWQYLVQAHLFGQIGRYSVTPVV